MLTYNSRLQCTDRGKSRDELEAATYILSTYTNSRTLTAQLTVSTLIKSFTQTQAMVAGTPHIN